MKLLRKLRRSASGHWLTLGELEAFCNDAREQGYSDDAAIWSSIWQDRDYIRSDHAIVSITVSEQGRQYGVSK